MPRWFSRGPKESSSRASTPLGFNPTDLEGQENRPSTDGPLGFLRRALIPSVPIGALSPDFTPLHSTQSDSPFSSNANRQVLAERLSPEQADARFTEIKTAVVNTMKFGLELAEKVADSFPVPGVKLALGGVMLGVGRLDTAQQNKKDVLELLGSIDSMTKALGMLRQNESPLGHEMTSELKSQIYILEGRLSMSKDNLEIEGLQLRLIELRNQLKTGVNPVARQHEIEDFELKLQLSKTKLEEARKQGKFRRFVNAQDDAQTVTDQFRNLGTSINQLLVSKTLTIEAQLADVQANLLLDKLPRAKDARYDFINNPKCLKGTREGVLETISEWYSKPQEHQIYWLNGGAGTGKTTVALTLAERIAQDKSISSASFFCSRGSEDRSQIKHIFPTLAYHLAQFNVDFRNELVRVLRQDSDVGHALRDTQFKKLILEPLLAMKPFLELRSKITNQAASFLLIIDALDECKESRAPEDVLRTIASGIDTIPFLKVLVSSRPTSSTNDAFLDKTLSKRREVFVLHDVADAVVQGDIDKYIDDRLKRKAEVRGLVPNVNPWPPRELVGKLVQKAAGLFIYASTVCELIEARGDLEYRLQQIANMPVNRPADIDSLYEQILSDAIKEFHGEKANINDCVLIVVTIIHLVNPLSRRDLALLLELPENHILSLLGDLQPVIIVPELAEDVLRTLHASFREFIPDKSKCLPEMYVEPTVHHTRMTTALLHYMNKELKRDMCGIGDRMLGDVPDIERHKLPGALIYACRHWVDHLRSMADAPLDETLIRNLDEFARSKILYWVEVLSLLQDSEGLHRVHQLCEWVSNWKLAGYPHLVPLIMSVGLAFKKHSEAIQSCPSQVYFSTVPFTPPESPLSIAYPSFHSVPFSSSFSPELDGMVNTLAVSPDCTYVVSGHADGHITTWNAFDAVSAANWRAHLRGVLAVTCSIDSQRIVSSSSDGTIKVWNKHDQALLETINLPHERTMIKRAEPWASLTFSEDGTLMAFVSQNSRHVWTTADWVEVKKKGGMRNGHWVAFSPDMEMECLAYADPRGLYLVDFDGLHGLDPPEAGSMADYPDEVAPVDRHRHLIFSEDGNLLRTTLGAYDISLGEKVEAMKNREKFPVTLWIDDGWVIDKKGRKRCWVPPEYLHDDSYTIQKNTIAFVGGGRLVILRLLE